MINYYYYYYLEDHEQTSNRGSIPENQQIFWTASRCMALSGKIHQILHTINYIRHNNPYPYNAGIKLGYV